MKKSKRGVVSKSKNFDYARQSVQETEDEYASIELPVQTMKSNYTYQESEESVAVLAQQFEQTKKGIYSPPIPPPLPMQSSKTKPSKLSNVPVPKTKQVAGRSPSPKKEKQSYNDNDQYPAASTSGALSLILNEGVLTQAKLRLKSNASVNLDRKMLFDQFECADYYPLDKIQDAFKSSELIREINLSGVEQLTDLFFIVLHHHYKSTMKSVSKLVLDGCHRITDLSADTIGDLFPSLEIISLSGCYAISEKFLVSLRSKCKKLRVVNVTATNVGIITDHEAVFDCELTVYGCPLVSPQLDVDGDGQNGKSSSGHYVSARAIAGANTDSTRESVWQTYKLLVIKAETTNLSFIHSLTNNKVTFDNRTPLSEHHQWSLVSGVTLNMVECTQELSNMLLSDRTVYVLPYSSGSTLEKCCEDVLGRLVPILCKMEHAVIVLVGESGNKSSVSVDSIVRNVKSHLEQLMDSILITANKKLFDSGQKVNFVEQMRLVNAFRLVRGIKTVELMGASELKDDQSILHLKSTLLEATKRINLLQPIYAHMPRQFSQVLSTLDITEGVHHEHSFVKDLCRKHVSLFGHQVAPYRKILELLNMLGVVIYFPEADPPLVITNIKWLAEELKSVHSSLAANKPFTSSEELSTALTCWGVLSRLRSDTTREIKLSWTVSLSEKPPLPWDYFMDSSSHVHVHTLQYQYKFTHAISAPMMSCLVSAVANGDYDIADPVFSVPVVVWQTGVIRLSGPITIGLQLMASDPGNNCVILQAQVVKSTQATDDVRMIKCLWNQMEFYRVPLEYFFHKLGFYCSFHKMKQLISPSFQISKLSSLPGVIEQRGCLITTNVSQPCRIDLPAMSCLDFKEVTLTILSGTGNIGFQMKSGDESLEFKVPKMAVKPTVVQSKKSSSMNVKPGGQSEEVVSVGDVMKVVLRLIRDSNKKLQQEVCLIWNGAQCESSLVAVDAKFATLLNISGSLTFMLDTTLMMKSSSLGIMWQKGMRLEARDRKTPSLICVATIIDVSENGTELLIHFDGWGDNYDYWADATSTDIHPVGWFAQRSDSHLELNQTLQSPRGYAKVPFDWDEYLKDVVDLPAPYEIFTEAQTERCLPFTPKPDTVQCLKERYKDIYSSHQCKYVKDHSHMFMSDVIVPWTNTEKIHELPRTPISVFLHEDLTLQKLTYPTNKPFSVLDNQAWYFLCTGRGTCLHFMDTPGVAIPSGTDLNLYYRAVCTILSQEKCRLPQHVMKMIKNAGDMDHEVLEEKLRLLFVLYLYNLYLTRSTDSAPSQVPSDDSHGDIIKPCKDVFDTYRDMASLSASTVSSDNGSTVNCSAHHYCQFTGDSMYNEIGGPPNIPLSKFVDHYHLIHDVTFAYADLETIPDEFFISLPCLKSLNLSHNKVRALPLGIGKCTKLEHLDLTDNYLASLPEDFAEAMMSITVLKISNNPLGHLPPTVISSPVLEELYAEAIGLEELPDAFNENSALKVLSLAENALDSLPPSFVHLKQVTDLNLSGVTWSPDSTLFMTRDMFANLLKRNPLFEKQNKDALFAMCDEKKTGSLDKTGIQKLNVEIFRMFKRFGAQKQQEDDDVKNDYNGCPPEIFSLTSLERLNLSYHGLVNITPKIQMLENLQELILNYNPLLESLPGALSKLPKLKEMPLRGCLSMKTPPKEITNRGFVAIMGFLRRLEMGSVECKRTKLMLVGLGGAGKTSLVDSLTENAYINRGKYGEQITDGIDIKTWIAHTNDDSISFSVWDFAGQTVYYNTHQFFLSNRAVYLLLWNIRLGYEHAGLDFWLSSIACHAPKAPVLIVGSHKDQVQKYWFPEKEMKKRYPQIQGFYAISSFTGEGIQQLKSDLTVIALKEKYMGERIPEVWLNFETSMMKWRTEESILPWDKVEECAVETGIVDKTETTQAIQFLHDLGSVQHFQNEFLKSRVVINPQWIVDAMSCIVSVNNTPIKEGKLYHSDIGLIWHKYPEELHSWLLRLTEEFDLTFPSKEEPANIVPCLLPATEPDFTWPTADSNVYCKELKVLYRFEYLPAGLFNRIQVRLYQFSDSSAIWKNGSFLRKNGHVALLTAEENNDIVVKVNGPRPENIIFMIHEVFEALLLESFHGVSYDLFVPCSDCIKAGSFDPCMFAASRIRRAVDLKAPFLQCELFFHTISLSELQTLMPPDSGADFDMQLERSIQDLNNLRADMTYDAFIVYCSANIPNIGEEETKVAPQTICNDLKKAGLKVWFSVDPDNVSVEQVTLTMREAKVVMCCMSNEFVSDARCMQLFYLAKNSMQKAVQIVLLGTDQYWMKSTDVGMQVSTEIYVNMMDSAKHRYPSKLPELVSNIKSKISASQPTAVHPKVFISYCWVNSHEAVKHGTREIKGALGFYDPRQLKQYIEDQGISVWLDIEQVAQGTLFEEIAEGLKHAKVVVVCSSDEYAVSKNCMMEFRFAAIQLNLPLVLSVVGTGRTWETTEVGMISLGNPKIDFQHENPTACDRLMQEIKKHVTEEDAQEERNSATSTPGSDNNHVAFQELLELAQRKFLREVTMYADSMDIGPFPRLFVLDFLSDQEKLALKPADSSKETQDTAAEAVKEQIDTKIEEHGSRPGTGQQSSRPVLSSAKSRPAISQRRTTGALSVFSQDATVSSGANESKESEYCIRTLCENEEGWHVTSHYLPLPSFSSNVEWESYLSDIASYMSRLIAVLKYTTIDLAILNSDRGEQLRKILNEKTGTESSFKEHYTSFRKKVFEMTTSENHEIIEVARCHLASGKTLWLCTEHQKQERIAILANDVAVAMPTLSRDVDMNIAQILNANSVSKDAAMVNTKSGVTEEPRKPSAASAAGTNSRASKTPTDMTPRPSSASTDKSLPANGQNAAMKDAGSAEKVNDGRLSSRTVARGKLIGAEMAVRIAAGHSINAAQGSKACIVM